MDTRTPAPRAWRRGALAAVTLIAMTLWPTPAPAAPAGCKVSVGDFRLLDGGRTLRNSGRVRCRAPRENVLLGVTVFRRVRGDRRLVGQRSKTASAASRLRVKVDVPCRNGRYLVKATFIYGPGQQVTRRRTFRTRGCA